MAIIDEYRKTIKSYFTVASPLISGAPPAAKGQTLGQVNKALADESNDFIKKAKEILPKLITFLDSFSADQPDSGRFKQEMIQEVIKIAGEQGYASLGIILAPLYAVEHDKFTRSVLETAANDAWGAQVIAFSVEREPTGTWAGAHPHWQANLIRAQNNYSTKIGSIAKELRQDARDTTGGDTVKEKNANTLADLQITVLNNTIAGAKTPEQQQEGNRLSLAQARATLNKAEQDIRERQSVAAQELCPLYIHSMHNMHNMIAAQRPLATATNTTQDALRRPLNLKV